MLMSMYEDPVHGSFLWKVVSGTGAQKQQMWPCRLELSEMCICLWNTICMADLVACWNFYGRLRIAVRPTCLALPNFLIYRSAYIVD